ncbi:MAG: phage terminase large subunit family protein [bacterium]|nr:phage terminase large subunit family protein [bacterium]
MQCDVSIGGLVREVMEGFRPPKKLTLSEWADEYAYLSPESSAETGKWHCFPYQRGMLDAFTDPSVEYIVVMKSARVGYTKMIDHAIGYYIHQDPCSIMVVQPTDQDAEDYSKDDIGPMLRDTPCIAGLVSDEKSRSSSNTLRKKLFRGGQLLLIGANAPSGFRRVTMRVVLFDEVDGYPPTAGTEGDQIRLGIKRTDTYWNRKISIGSTPTIDRRSRIQEWFEFTNQMRYFVPCPFCGHMQFLRWSQIKWDEGKPETARYECEHCHRKINHSQKSWMIERGEWRPTTEGRKGYVGFHIWAGYSYHPNSTWEKLAAEFEEVKGHPEQLKTFVNTVLGEVWIDKGEAPEWERLYERREGYQRNAIPSGGVILTAGCDVQADRLEVEIVAWGRNNESWSIDYRVFPGKTDDLKSPCWQQLTAVLSEQWRDASGMVRMIEKLAVDSGYNTQTVYNWVRAQDVSRVVATKGVETAPAIINQPKAVEVRENGKRVYRGIKVWTVGTNIGKSELYSWLKQARDPEKDIPYGWCHFPEYDVEFFKQLTAEQTIPRIVRGYRRYVWEKMRERNEALDCRVLNRAMAVLIGVDRFSEEEWKKREGVAAGEHKTKKKKRESSFWN